MSDDHQLPVELRHALDEACAGVRLADLREASRRLTAVYREPERAEGPGAFTSDLDRLAYAVSRMPATYEALRAVLLELQAACPDLRIRQLLDLGSGPGTSLWAAAAVFDRLSQVELVERDPGMVALGRRLVTGASIPGRPKVAWHIRSVQEDSGPAHHDLVVCSYLLGELPAKARASVVAAAWQATTGALVLLEPGSPSGFRRVLEARRWLIASGATIVAPCPHDGSCPMPADDWCHFGARLNRSARLRRLKDAALPYEDEKFAYLVVSREPATPADARVLDRPRLGSGQVALRLCTRDGLREVTLTRRAGPAYRRARKIRWGERWANGAYETVRHPDDLG